MSELKQRLMHLFLSRRFIVMIIVIPLLWFGKITPDIFLWVIMGVLGTNTIDKFKTEINDTIKKKK